jgi:uncharacterized protein YuzE
MMGCAIPEDKHTAGRPADRAAPSSRQISAAAVACEPLGMVECIMRVTYDSEANAAYVELGDDVAGGTAVENVVVERPGRGDIVLDFDADGRLLGVEVIGATQLLRKTVLDTADGYDPRGLGG